MNFEPPALANLLHSVIRAARESTIDASFLIESVLRHERGKLRDVPVLNVAPPAEGLAVLLLTPDYFACIPLPDATVHSEALRAQLDEATDALVQQTRQHYRGYVRNS